MSTLSFVSFGKWIVAGFVALGLAWPVLAEESAATVVYRNELRQLDAPRPILADYPHFVEPVREVTRYEAPLLVDDEGADLEVRAWRFSYNARGIIEMPNRLRARDTAIVVVHPWGIDDGQGWDTPEPAGVAFFCTPEKNRIGIEHVEQVLDPWLRQLRERVGVVAYSLPGKEDLIRRKVYRSVRQQPTDEEREAGSRELDLALRSFPYQGEPLATTLELDPQRLVASYFERFPGLDAGARFNHAGFWDLPIPVVQQIAVAPEDVVFYDGEGYNVIREFLRAQGIRHVLLAGYATDMCYCSTTAGYENLSPDFNVFLVGDATLATFPANDSPGYATNAAISFAALKQLVTQVSWIRELPGSARAGAGP